MIELAFETRARAIYFAKQVRGRSRYEKGNTLLEAPKDHVLTASASFTRGSNANFPWTVKIGHKKGTP